MKSIKLLSFVAVFFGFTFLSSAQTLQDVVDAYNSAREYQAVDNWDKVIAALERCIELSEQVDDVEALRIQGEAIQVLPNSYLQKATKIPKDDHPALLQALEEAVSVAQKYNDTRTMERAEREIPQVYAAMGNKFRLEQNFEEAITNFDEAILRNPNIAVAYFLKGVCYESMRDEPNMEENYRLAIEKGRAFGDAQNARQAQERLRNFYNTAGRRAFNERKWDDAIASFTQAIEVDDNFFEAYQFLIISYNGKSSWDNAIAYSAKALQIKEEPRIFYELGVAYYGKKDNARACENFRKVKSGDQVVNARKYVTEILKCN